ncbi:SUMF1/EgtB/PvdO family nonheme iron enzyme [Thermodesulfobacteriota bacterium]
MAVRLTGGVFLGNVISIDGIEEAVNNLRYKNKNSLKYRLIHTIREFYSDGENVQSIVSIDPDELIKKLWDTGENPSVIKHRRKNLSSIKSSINNELKKLYKDGKNSEGVVIGPTNVFEMSAEAKDRILESFKESASGIGSAPMEQIMDVLKIVNEQLTSPIAENDQGGLKRLDQIKDLIKDLSENIGLKDKISPDTSGDTIGSDGNGQEGQLDGSDSNETAGSGQGEGSEKPDDHLGSKGGLGGIGGEGNGANEAGSNEGPRNNEELEGIIRTADISRGLEKSGSEKAYKENAQAETPGINQDSDGSNLSGGVQQGDGGKHFGSEEIHEFTESEVDTKKALVSGDSNEVHAQVKDSGPGDIIADDVTEGDLIDPDLELDVAEGNEEGEILEDDIEDMPEGLEEVDVEGDLEELYLAEDSEDEKSLEGLDEQGELEDSESESDYEEVDSEADSEEVDLKEGEENEEIHVELDQSEELEKLEPEDDLEEVTFDEDADDEVVIEEDMSDEVEEEESFEEASELDDFEEIQAEDDLEKIDASEDLEEIDLAEDPEYEELPEVLGEAEELEDSESEVENEERDLVDQLDDDEISEEVILAEEDGETYETEGQENKDIEDDFEEVDLAEDVEAEDIIEPSDESEDLEELIDEEDFEEMDLADLVEEKEDLDEIGLEEDFGEEDVTDDLEADEVIDETDAEEELEEIDLDEDYEEADVANDLIDDDIIEEVLDGTDASDEIEEVDADDDIEDIDVTDNVEDDEVLEELDTEEEIEKIDPEEDFGELDVIEDLEEDESLEEIEEDGDFEKDELEGSIDHTIDFVFDELLEEYSDYGYTGEDGTRKAKLLAEVFNNALATMDRYYNQYIQISKGRYIVGSRNPGNVKRPRKELDIDSFYLGKFPVTNALFEIFIEKTGYVTTAERIGYGAVYYGRYQKIIDEETGLETLNWSSSLESRVVEGACWYQPLGPGSTLHNKRSHPVVQVSREDAMAFAAWTGKRLPTENEWEAASRTTNGDEFPWGNELKETSCNIEESYIGGTSAVDTYKQHANDFGIVDTIGNVLEWTLDCIAPLSTGEKDVMFITKGGSWVSGREVSLSSRFKSPARFASNILGFRCVAC